MLPGPSLSLWNLVPSASLTSPPLLLQHYSQAISLVTSLPPQLPLSPSPNRRRSQRVLLRLPAFVIARGPDGHPRLRKRFHCERQLPRSPDSNVHARRSRPGKFSSAAPTPLEEQFVRVNSHQSRRRRRQIRSRRRIPKTLPQILAHLLSPRRLDPPRPRKSLPTPSDGK